MPMKVITKTYLEVTILKPTLWEDELTLAVRLRDISSIILNDVIWSMKINKIVDNAWNYKGPE